MLRTREAAVTSGPEPGPLLRSLVPAPEAIEPLSLSRIAAEAGELPWSGAEAQMATRIAYAVGDASVLADFACSPGAVQAGVEALRRGAPIIADVRMVLTGIDHARTRRLSVEVRTGIDDPEVARIARERGITRSAQAMLSYGSDLDGAIVAIGNAPTALLALLDMVDAGIVRPAVILGFPVGYVAAAESKDELVQRDVPYITMRGRRGGTPMAVAAANTLLRMATEGLDASPPAAATVAAMTDDRIRVIGIGDDGLDGLGARARSLIANARTLYGGTRQLAMVADTRARRVDLSTSYTAALEELVSGACGAGAVVLASGDPMLFGIGSTLARHFGAAPERLEVIPHASSVQLALARLGEPAHEVAVLTALARPLRPVLAAGMAAQRFAVLLDPTHSAATVARAFLDAGMEDARAAVCGRLEGADERITRGTLSSVAAGTFDPLSILVVLRDRAEVDRQPRAGIPDAAFAHRAGLITKPEVRVLAIAALQLRPADTLWDIGAGSGSIGIEAASLLPRGAVHAVERDAEQIAFIETNRVRFRAPQVEAVHGAAPDALDTLLDPDAVFIGGGGAMLPAILEVVMRRLRAGGRVVITLATLERLAPTLDALKAWSPELRQVSIAHGVPLADGTRLDPANPILLVAATKPSEA